MMYDLLFFMHELLDNNQKYFIIKNDTENICCAEKLGRYNDKE